MDKTKILWWIIGLLFVLNVSIGATILYRNSQTTVNERVIVVETETMSLSQQYLCQTLKLCEEQKSEFCPKHKIFKREANKIIEDIDLLKQQMFDEMISKNPNLERLDELSESIGNLHAQLKKVTVKFYLDTEDICSTMEQKSKLKEIFDPLFQNVLCDKQKLKN